MPDDKPEVLDNPADQLDQFRNGTESAPSKKGRTKKPWTSFSKEELWNKSQTATSESVKKLFPPETLAIIGLFLLTILQFLTKLPYDKIKDKTKDNVNHSVQQVSTHFLSNYVNEDTAVFIALPVSLSMATVEAYNIKQEDDKKTKKESQTEPTINTNKEDLTNGTTNKTKLPII